MKTSLFAVLLLALSLTACNSEKSASTEAAPSAAPATVETAPAVAETPAAAPLSAEEAEKEKIRKQNAAAEAALSGH